MRTVFSFREIFSNTVVPNNSFVFVLSSPVSPVFIFIVSPFVFVMFAIWVFFDSLFIYLSFPTISLLFFSVFAVTK